MKLLKGISVLFIPFILAEKLTMIIVFKVLKAFDLNDR
jgi:hypothetical protein